MKIFFLRHGETQWNKLKKFQGHTNIPLSQDGINQVSSWHVPGNIEHWFISPLDRAVQTADIHNLQPRTITPELVEAYWGDWEGEILKELRKLHPKMVGEIESQGLDMRPPGGETPREVRTRLENWLLSVSTNFGRLGIVTHRGVIRAALSLATNWDMLSDHAVNITHNQAYEFSWKVRKLEFITHHELIV